MMIGLIVEKTSLMRTWHYWGKINSQPKQIFQVCISCFLNNFHYLKLKWHWMTSLHFFKTPHDQVEAVPVSTQTHLQRRCLTQFKVAWKKQAKIPMQINVQKKTTYAWHFNPPKKNSNTSGTVPPSLFWKSHGSCLEWITINHLEILRVISLCLTQLNKVYHVGMHDRW